MTRTYAAIRLFEHGPLSLRGFAQITGWGYQKSRRTIGHLSETGRIEFRNGLWQLTENL